MKDYEIIMYKVGTENLAISKRTIRWLTTLYQKSQQLNGLFQIKCFNIEHASAKLDQSYSSFQSIMTLILSSNSSESFMVLPAIREVLNRLHTFPESLPTHICLTWTSVMYFITVYISESPRTNQALWFHIVLYYTSEDIWFCLWNVWSFGFHTCYPKAKTLTVMCFFGFFLEEIYEIDPSH